MFDWFIYRTPKILNFFKVKLRWSKSSRLSQPIALLVQKFATGFFPYPLKISANLWFSDFLRDIERDQWHEMG